MLVDIEDPDDDDDDDELYIGDVRAYRWDDPEIAHIVEAYQRSGRLVYLLSDTGMLYRTYLLRELLVDIWIGETTIEWFFEGFESMFGTVVDIYAPLRVIDPSGVNRRN